MSDISIDQDILRNIHAVLSEISSYHSADMNPDDIEQAQKCLEDIEQVFHDARVTL